MTTRTLAGLSVVVAALAVVGLFAGAAHTAAPVGRYVVGTDGTVLDSKTGLTWQHTAPPSTYNLAAAKAYCAASTNLPGTGWRLPTIKELATLLDAAKPGGYFFDTTVFNVPTNPVNTSAVFWSATAYKGPRPPNWSPTDTGAWTFYFQYGATQANLAPVGAWVRCVR